MLEKEFQFFIDNQQELVSKYLNRFIIIQEDKVLGDFPDIASAVIFAQKNKLIEGSYLLQLCKPGEEAYSQTFHSRVVFA